MKAKIFAALATCLVMTTGAVGTPAAGMPATGTPAGPKTITVDAMAQTRFGVSVATLKGAAAPNDASTTGFGGLAGCR